VVGIGERANQDATERALDVDLAELQSSPVEDVTRAEEWTRVTLCGEIDLYNANDVREVLERECSLRPRRLVIDLSAVDYLDSTALQVLLNAGKKLAGGGELVVLAPTASVRRVLKISGIDRVLTVLDSDGAKTLHEIRCTRCGYGAIAAASTIRCPMCGGESWDRDGVRAGASTVATSAMNSSASARVANHSTTSPTMSLPGPGERTP
jgi:anti-sigma B factor antagonist